MRKGLFFVFACLFGIFSIAIFSVLLYFYCFRNKNERNDFKNTYKLSTFNTKTNSTTNGFVQISKKLLDQDFISFWSSDKLIFSTISKDSDDDYECYGTCFCNDQKIDSKRRAFTNILSKSIYFAVSAISLTLAIKIAKSFFVDECYNSLLGTCSEEFIDVDVDECRRKYWRKKGTIKKKMILDEETNELMEDPKKSYYCYGHCVPNLKIRNPDASDARETFHCEKHEISGKVSVIPNPPQKPVTMARDKFVVKFLVQYCGFVSSFKAFYPYVDSSQYKRVKGRWIKLCVAQNGADGKNRVNVRCQSLT